MMCCILLMNYISYSTSSNLVYRKYNIPSMIWQRA
nr:MAG TPA: hypothetical protein [Caudoviricetes sp.]